jgi:hypothetical protein
MLRALLPSRSKARSLEASEAAQLTIQDLGSIGELVAAIATVATLAYLALQIRQNTSQLRENARAVRLAEARAATEGEAEFHRLLLADPELDDVLRRARHGDELNSVDLGRFHRLLTLYMLRYQLVWNQTLESVFPEAYWDRLATRAIYYLSNEAAQRWWPTFRGALDPRFVTDIEQRLKKKSPTV